MSKRIEFFEKEAKQDPSDRPESIFKINEAGKLDIHIPDEKSESIVNKIVVHFFAEYFYMGEEANLKEFMDSLEKGILIKILGKFNGSQKNAAKFLGINSTTLNQKIKKHNIRFRKSAIE